MVAVDQGIAQLVILIRKLYGRRVKNDALLHAVALGEGTGGNVADDDLQGNDGDLLHQRLPFAQLLNEVGGYAGLLQLGHKAVAHLVVDDALARDGAFFQAVKGRGVVLVVDDKKCGIIGFEYFLCFALIELFQLLHRIFLPNQKGV